MSLTVLRGAADQRLTAESLPLPEQPFNNIQVFSHTCDRLSPFPTKLKWTKISSYILQLTNLFIFYLFILKIYYFLNLFTWLYGKIVKRAKKITNKCLVKIKNVILNNHSYSASGSSSAKVLFSWDLDSPKACLIFNLSALSHSLHLNGDNVKAKEKGASLLFQF